MNMGISRMGANNAANGANLVFSELSYELMGILFDVQNELGSKYQEKHYQRAIEIRLKQAHIPYAREVMVKAKFQGQELGRFFIDFVIDNKILIETKKVGRITSDDVKQVLRYLEATGLTLGIIVNFNSRRLEYRRVVRSTRPSFA